MLLIPFQSSTLLLNCSISLCCSLHFFNCVRWDTGPWSCTIMALPFLDCAVFIYLKMLSLVIKIVGVLLQIKVGFPEHFDVNKLTCGYSRTIPLVSFYIFWSHPSIHTLLVTRANRGAELRFSCMQHTLFLPLSYYWGETDVQMLKWILRLVFFLPRITFYTQTTFNNK